jgi:hypothetical protein
MASLNYSIASALSEKLNEGGLPPIDDLSFYRNQFVPVHCHAYVPSNMNEGDVYSWVVCNGAGLAEGQDRCSSIWVWNLSVVITKRLQCRPDEYQLQPAAFEELDALMQLSEWCINKIGDTKSVQATGSNACAQVVGMDIQDMPNQETASQGMWMSEFLVTLHGRMKGG